MSPVRTVGAHRHSRARILWIDGTLYLVTSTGKVTSWVTAEPVRDVVGWAVTLPGGEQLRWSRSGCSCQNPAKRLTVEQIVAASAG